LIVRDDLLNFTRGGLMGCADIVPGVSGGTVALILGIYERLIGAISRVDMIALGALRRGALREFAQRIDLRFLIGLGLGIATALLALGSTMHFLLEHHRERTLAAFFGMIIASTILVLREIDGWKAGTAVAFVGGVGFAYWLVGLPVFEDPPRGLPWIFVCGMVAICAMILPGISGAFILLILGEYYEVTGVLKEFASGRFTSASIALVVTFAAGALIGLLSFSRVLRWLLRTAKSLTMAVLAGFMLGSLRKIWPFQIDTTPGEVDFKHKIFDNVTPDWSAGSTWMTVVVGVVAGVFVLLLERTAARTNGAKS
jgi:putative membrane protein